MTKILANNKMQINAKQKIKVKSCMKKYQIEKSLQKQIKRRLTNWKALKREIS